MAKIKSNHPAASSYLPRFAKVLQDGFLAGRETVAEAGLAQELAGIGFRANLELPRAGGWPSKRSSIVFTASTWYCF